MKVQCALRAAARDRRAILESMHLVDTTLFYSPTSGGVKRYLTAKHAWLAAHSSWEHTIVVPGRERSEEHTSELQSQSNLVCRLLLEKKKKKNNRPHHTIRYEHESETRLTIPLAKL